MSKFPVGMKIYNNDWSLKYGFRPREAAEFIAELGVNFVITQSHILPMQSSTVFNAHSAPDGLRNDLEFREELKKCGVRYFACMNVGFDPEAARKNPEILPVDQYGNPGEQCDWYVGIPLSNRAFIDDKAQKLRAAVDILQPDGLHFGFARWPGFWETWQSGMTRNNLREFCFSHDTMQQFGEWSRLSLPIDDPIACASQISTHHRALFTDWKCTITHDMIATLKAAARDIAKDIPVAVNTVPFQMHEFDGALEHVLGQRHATLPDVVDIFEVMAYHQILKRDIAWPAKIASVIKETTGQTTYCTLQTGAHYLSGMHENAGRIKTVRACEVQEMVDKLLATDVDGLCFFTLADFLDGPEKAELARIVRSIA